MQTLKVLRKAGNGSTKTMVKTNENKLAQVIHSTKDYDIFKRLKGNRPIIPSHVAQLVNSMREHDLLVPIIVNEKMQIIDGQHRVEARRELGLPVPYIQSSGMDLSDVQKLNSTAKGWVSDDYARSFIEQGNQHYSTYMDFRKTYGLPHEVSVLLLAGRGPKAVRSQFIRGEFRVTDLEGARSMANILHAQIKPIFPYGWKDSSFVRALYIANSRIGFDMERFISLLPAQRFHLQVYRSVDSYLLMIENIYNSVPGRKKIAIRYGDSIPLPRDEGGKFAPTGASHAALSDAKRKSMPNREFKAGGMPEKIISILSSGNRMKVKNIAAAFYGRDDLTQKERDDISFRLSDLKSTGDVIRTGYGTYQIAPNRKVFGRGAKHNTPAQVKNAQAQNARMVAEKRRNEND